MSSNYQVTTPSGPAPLPIHSSTYDQNVYKSSNKFDFPLGFSQPSSSPPISSIYSYKNDPKQINKGVRMTNAINPQGGHIPILSETSYDQRRQDQNKFNYDNKSDHGSRPQHKSSFNIITHDLPNHHQMTTSNKIDYRGLKTRPEYRQCQGEDQFKSHFSLASSSSSVDHFNSSYADQFPDKSRDQDYTLNFDLMPKYSLPKQIFQLEKESQVRVYKNQTSSIRDTLVRDEKDPNFWTQYKRTHDHLGQLRGQGVQRSYSDRRGFNVLTGEESSKPAWSMNQNFKRSSGNNMLNSSRKVNSDQKSLFLSC